MLFLTLTSAALIAATPLAPATATVPVCAPAASASVANPHLLNARAAIAKGDITTARREFRFATIVDRDEGCLPVESSNGLASLLFAQSQKSEAAEVMQELAEEAAKSGDINVEARALVSATWLRIEAGDRLAAKAGVRRLREIAKDSGLTSETRALLKERLG